MPELGAVIFDFDGTIADSEPFHLAAFQRTFSEELGLDLTEAQYKERYLAFDDRRMIQRFLADRAAAAGPERLARLLEIKEAHYAALAGSPVILPGAPALIRACAQRWPLAIASGALQNEIRPVLEGAGLVEYFSPIISAEMVERGKPDPESFLAALDGINEGRAEKIDRAACLVVEDSVAGVDSGRAAGMRVLAVTNSYPREQLGGADRVVDSLEEAADSEALAAWFAGLAPR